MKWQIIKGGDWWYSYATKSGGVKRHSTWQEAFDHAFKEATRELADR